MKHHSHFALSTLASLLLAASSGSLLKSAADDPIQTTRFHLTARPWKALNASRDQYLQALEGVCRFSIRHQNAEGAIIDPFLHREHQYATPYFANAVATLVAAGHAKDLAPNGIRAMEHATRCFAGGQKQIPDQHGNFFIAALTGALEQWRGHVPQATWETWRDRMRTPRKDVISETTNNWETYVMKGEWMRVKAGLADRADAIAAIEKSWALRQRARFADPPWRLYHDRTSEPDTLNVEAVGRGNVLALADLGYDGPAAKEMREWTEAATRLTLWLQDPTGQVPTNGRTDNHVWVEVGYLLGFEAMAERLKTSDPWMAGQFRRAAMLGFTGMQKWRRTDGDWAGSYYVTKNRFDPALRVGYQDASQYSNYNGSLMFHLAEAWHTRHSEIKEQPAPSEIGGYAIATDPQFASAFANAGGMQMQLNLRGQTTVTHGNRWTPLGVVRFSRTGWESRLGPSDGALALDPAQGGVSFGPTFMERDEWLRLADLPERYEGRWETSFVHPLLVRCAVTWWPKSTLSGPVFRQEFTLTPDGILVETRRASTGALRWGVTVPLLQHDGGATMDVQMANGVASTGWPGTADRQNFLVMDGTVTGGGTAIRGSYGDLLPVRVDAADGAEISRIFVYPSGAGDPAASAVRSSLRMTPDGFSSSLGRVSGGMYVGRTSAGGVGDRVDLNGDGKADLVFSARCAFIVQVANGKAIAVEADRAVTVTVNGSRRATLRPHVPLSL